MIATVLSAVAAKNVGATLLCGLFTQMLRIILTSALPVMYFLPLRNKPSWHVIYFTLENN